MNNDKELEKYLKEYQDNPNSRVFAPLAEAYRKNGMSQEAVEICIDGLKYHPDFNSGKVSLARAYIDLKNFRSAIDVLEDVIESAPDNLMANILLAESYKQISQYDDSLKVYTYLASLDSDNVNIKEKISELEDLVSGEKDFVDEKKQELNFSEDEQINIDIKPHPYELIPDFDKENFNMYDTSDFEVKKTEDIFRETSQDSDEKIVQELASETMAELLEEQGYKEKALEIYKILLKKEPETERYIGKITELEIDLGLINTRNEDIDAAQTDKFTEDEAVKSIYSEDISKITTLPPEFDLDKLDPSNDGFENKEISTMSNKEEENSPEEVEIEEKPLEEKEEVLSKNEDIKDNKADTPKIDVVFESESESKNEEWLLPEKKLEKLEKMFKKIQNIKKQLK